MMSILVEWRYESAERGYQLLLQHDLLGDLVVTRRWWGLYNGRGGGRSDPVQDEKTGRSLVEREDIRRRKHGYALRSYRCLDEPASKEAAPGVRSMIEQGPYKPKNLSYPTPFA